MGSLFQREGAACENDRLQNLKEDMTGGRLRVRCEEDRVGPWGWMWKLANVGWLGGLDGPVGERKDFVLDSLWNF